MHAVEAPELALPAAIQLLQAQARRVSSPLTVDGAVVGQITWHVWGQRRPGALPCVLLHGGSGSWTHWLRSIALLVDQGLELWIPDLPGFGDSDAVPGGSDVDSLVDPLAASLQQVLGPWAQAPGPLCDLVGFSFGGMAAGMLAAAHPGLARRLVIVGAPALGVTEGRSVRLKGWRHLPSGEAQQQAHHFNLAALMLLDAGGIDDTTLRLHALNVARDRLPRRRLSRTDILAQALARVQVPVHAIYGSHDVLYLGQAAQLQAVLERQPGFAGLQWVAQAGHWVQHEQPQAFVAALQQALAATPVSV